MLLALLPATQGAVDLVNGSITALLKAEPLPKLDFSKEVPEEMTTLVAQPKKPPPDEPKAAAAMAAFYKGDRKAALAHPQGALAVALAERAPRNDTRKAVLASPRAALEYALFVDRAPRPDTRASAAKTSETAYLYARHVDMALVPATRQALDRKEWKDADIESFAAELAARRADLGR